MASSTPRVSMRNVDLESSVLAGASRMSSSGATLSSWATMPAIYRRRSSDDPQINQNMVLILEDPKRDQNLVSFNAKKEQ